MLITNDRRAALRLPTTGPVLVRVARYALRGSSIDLGLGGIGAYGRQRLPTHAHALVTLQLAGRPPVELYAHVVRSTRWNGGHRWGLRFTHALDPGFVHALDHERLRIARYRQAHPYLARLTPSAPRRLLTHPSVSLQEPTFPEPAPQPEPQPEPEPFDDRPTAVFQACPQLVPDPVQDPATQPLHAGPPSLHVDLRERPSGSAHLRWQRLSTHRIALSFQLGAPQGVPHPVDDDETPTLAVS